MCGYKLYAVLSTIQKPGQIRMITNHIFIKTCTKTIHKIEACPAITINKNNQVNDFNLSRYFRKKY